MVMRLVEDIVYAGVSGVNQLKALQAALNSAIEKEDWDSVRRLDQSCMLVIDKVIAANKDDGAALAAALNELKGVYVSLIVRCKCEVASMMH
jgi:flagellar protein FliT